MGCNMQLVVNHRKPRAKVSIILLDWGIRESFHSIRYLNTQTVPRDQYELIWVEFYDRKPPDLVRLTMLSSLYALTLVVLFLVFQAPDVALSELVVGAVGFPLAIIVAIVLERGR